MKGLYTKAVKTVPADALSRTEQAERTKVVVVVMIYTMGRGPTLITHIWTHPDYRGRRYASKLFDEVLADADKEGQQLILSVQPDPGGMTWLQLAEWYKQRGFVPARLADFYEDGDGTMIRNPRTLPDYMADLERDLGFTQP
jgi:ribosomal protein S18 acetylase RimI-like enzyme